MRFQLLCIHQERTRKGELMRNIRSRPVTTPSASQYCNAESVTALCSDDDPNVGDAMRLWLDRYQIDVLAAEFGTQGIELATKHRHYAIFTDAQKPQGKRKPIVSCLKQLPESCDVPIIVLPESKDDLLRLRLTKRGAEHFPTSQLARKCLRNFCSMHFRITKFTDRIRQSSPI